MKRIINFIKKVFANNYCETCGFTKHKVYVTEYFSEGGFIQCKKCFKNK